MWVVYALVGLLVGFCIQSKDIWGCPFDLLVLRLLLLCDLVGYILDIGSTGRIRIQGCRLLCGILRVFCIECHSLYIKVVLSGLCIVLMTFIFDVFRLVCILCCYLVFDSGVCCSILVGGGLYQSSVLCWEVVSFLWVPRLVALLPHFLGDLVLRCCCPFWFWEFPVLCWIGFVMCCEVKWMIFGYQVYLRGFWLGLLVCQVLLNPRFYVWRLCT